MFIKGTAFSAFLGLALLAGAPALAADAAGATPAKPVKEKLICKSRPETGSLVKKSKQCFTRDEWAKLNDASQRGATDMIDRNKGMLTSGN